MQNEIIGISPFEVPMLEVMEQVWYKFHSTVYCLFFIF